MEIDFKKDIQPSIDALFSGKYDLSVKPKEEGDAVCNISLLLRVLMIEAKTQATRIAELEKKCMCSSV